MRFTIYFTVGFKKEGEEGAIVPNAPKKVREYNSKGYKACVICGSSLEGKSKQFKYCSRGCKHEGMRRLAKKYYRRRNAK